MKTKFLYEAATALAISLAPATGFADSPWGSVLAWEGHYPVDHVSGHAGDLFTQPVLARALAEILSPADRRLLEKNYAVQGQVQRVAGYDVLSDCEPHDCPAENVTLIIDPNSPTILVAFFLHHGNVISTRWYGTEDYAHLPPEILNQVLWGHEPKP